MSRVTVAWTSRALVLLVSFTSKNSFEQRRQPNDLSPDWDAIRVSKIWRRASRILVQEARS